MTKARPPSPMNASEYEAIYDAMMETSRGRWFLHEYTDRNRSADTVTLLDAIAKLESAISRPRVPPEADGVLSSLMEMSKAIQKTREEIAAIKTPDSQDTQILGATEELDSIVRATEYATNDILQAAENIQEMAWTLRESGVDNETCDDLDGRATDIYTACSFQDITGQRTRKVVQVLRYIEASLESMIEIWQPAERREIESKKYNPRYPAKSAFPPALEHHQHLARLAEPGRHQYQGAAPEHGFSEQNRDEFSVSDLESFLMETEKSDATVHYPAPVEYSSAPGGAVVRVPAPSRPVVAPAAPTEQDDRPPAATEFHYSTAPAQRGEAGPHPAQSSETPAPADGSGPAKPAPGAPGAVRAGDYRRPAALSVQTLDEKQKAVLFNKPSR